MAVPTAPATLVLHGLRVKGFAETDVLATVLGLTDVEVVRDLEAFAVDDLVRRKDGVEVSGWVLTPEGRAEHEARLAAELDATGARPAVAAAYDDFVALNPELLAVCSDWQLRDGVRNDHTDAGHDRAVLDRLAVLHERAQPVVTALGEALARFAPYGPRLDRAAAKVAAGDTDWVDAPLEDSYHTVWFELHEDLLATLGHERGAETGGTT